MRATEQLYLVGQLIKAAGRGDFVLKAIRGATPSALHSVMSAHVAADLGEFARLPQPLAEPPMIPWGRDGQLRRDWQPPLTRNVEHTQWSNFLASGQPESDKATWMNALQRTQLARMVRGLRKQASRGDYASDLLNRTQYADPIWVNSRTPGFGQFIEHHLPNRDLERLNRFTTLTPAVDYSKAMSPRQIRKLPSDAVSDMASHLRLLRLAQKFRV